MNKENKKTVEATLHQLLLTYMRYMTDDCFDNEDKKFFYEQAEQILAKLRNLNMAL